MSKLTTEMVLKALAGVNDPELGRSLVELDMIRDVEIAEEGKVAFTVVLTTPACPLKAVIEKDCLSAVSAIDGVEDVEVRFDATVQGGPRSQEDPMPGVEHVLLVMSGKGGVGKSTLSANIALALQQAGAKVGLLDADVHGPSLPTILGANETPTATPDGRILPPETQGVRYLSMGQFLEREEQAVIWRGPMLSGLLKQFLTQVEWGDLDYLICDLPPGTGDPALTVMQTVKVTGAVIVTTPQDVALVDVKKAVDMCREVEIPVIGVVENMSYFICPDCDARHELFGRGGGQAVATFASAPLLGQVALDAAIREDGDRGTPSALAPDSERGKSLIEAAKAIAARIASEGLGRTAGGPLPPQEGPAHGCGHAH